VIIRERPASKGGFGYERRRGVEERKTSILRNEIRIYEVRKMNEEKENRKNELYARMKEIRLNQHETFSDQFRFVRGKGLVKRDTPAK
jgi:hypothetical protein